MLNSIETEINKYQAKFPLLNREAIIDKMFKDGIFDKMLKTGDIKQSDIEKLKKGESLFLTGKKFYNVDTPYNGKSIREIFGGHFTKTKPEVDVTKTTPHKFTSLVDVNYQGKIFTSQFTMEGIRKKFDEKKYKIKQEINKEYPNFSTITIIDRKTNKKAFKYQIYNSNYDNTGSVDIYAYEKDGKTCKESTIVHRYDNDCYVGKVSKMLDKKRCIDTFYEFRSENIQKTYEWSVQIQKGKKVFDIDKVTLYSKNKPYKELKGDYESTISNYTVDEIAKILGNKTSLNFQEQMELSSLINTITKKNVYEMVFDYQTKTGRDLLDDIQKFADKEKDKPIFYVQTAVARMTKHIRDCMKYEGAFSNDSWLNDHAEAYIVNRLVNDIEHGEMDMFKEDLKLAGINLSKEEKPLIEIFGNPMISKVLTKFQQQADSLYKYSKEDKGLTKGILYTIAKSDSIQPKEKADILLDTMTQLGFIRDDAIRKEIGDFTKSNEFMNLMTKYCTEGKYSADILADIKLNRNNPDKILVDFKRLKARNTPRKEGTEVTKPNGKIDIDFKQGRTGDCWLLAGVISLCKKNKGKANLESLLQVDPKTGDVTVTLKGAKKKYRIPYDEIKNSNHLSGGDGDIVRWSSHLISTLES